MQCVLDADVESAKCFSSCSSEAHLLEAQRGDDVFELHDDVFEFPYIVLELLRVLKDKKVFIKWRLLVNDLFGKAAEAMYYQD